MVMEGARIKMDIAEYKRLEKQLLYALGMNLNLPCVRNYLDSYILDKSDERMYQTYYHLELGLNNEHLLEKYSLKEICVGVIYSMESNDAKRQQQRQEVDEAVGL